MRNVTALPSYLVQRYHGWKATAFTENRAWYRILPRMASGRGRW